MNKNDENGLLDRLTDKMKRVDEKLIKELMEKENLSRSEAEKKLKDLKI